MDTCVVHYNWYRYKLAHAVNNPIRSCLLTFLVSWEYATPSLVKITANTRRAQ